MAVFWQMTRFFKYGRFLEKRNPEKIEMEPLAMDIGNVRDKNNFVTS